VKKTKPSKKVLLVAPQPFYEDRGTPIVILEELKILCHLGYQVDVATFPIGLDIKLPGVNIIRTINPLKFKSVAVGLSFRKLMMDLFLLFTVLRLTKREAYHCIHGVEEGAAIAIVCKTFFGIPIIYDMHSCIPDQLSKFKYFREGSLGGKIAICFESFLINRADAIIASTGLAGHVLSKDPQKQVWECNFPSIKTSVENNESLARKNNIDNRPTIVYTGNFSSYQGLDLLIEAAKLIRLTIPDIQIVLVGGSKLDSQALNSLIERYNLEGNVKLYNRVPRKKVADFLRIADVLVLPRRHGKNVPFKLFEYMSSKKPIVATNIPAHSALLNDQIAFLVKPEAASLAKGLVCVINDKKLASRLASSSFEASTNLKKLSFQETLSKSYRFTIRKNRLKRSL
jgi:glycosyltransferase involved in cell wall biosynthesis